MRWFKKEKLSKNYGAINSLSIKTNERSGLIKIFLEVSIDAPSDLKDISNIPSPIISDFELLDYVQTEELWNYYAMAKCKVCSKDKEITVEPHTKEQFDLVRKIELEVRM